MKKNRPDTSNTVNCISQAFELYNDAIGQEALERVGNNPQLKGVIHEMLFRDKLNLNIRNRLHGNTAVLTRNPRAHDVDVIVMGKNGRAVNRYQVKDCTSPSGIGDTLGKTRNGRYRSTKLVGTNETTTKYNQRAGVGDKPMQSTGISSNRTGRIADNTGINTVDKNQLLHNMQDIGSCAATSAAIGAGISFLSSVVDGHARYARGEIDGAEYMESVITETGKGAVNAGATTAAALCLKEGGKQLGKNLGNQALKRFAGSNAATAIAFGAVEVGCDLYKLGTGEIDGCEFGKKTMATTGGAAGGYGGAVAGAALGTMILPGIGTGIGAFLGGLMGGLGGNSIGSGIGSLIFD